MGSHARSAKLGVVAGSIVSLVGTLGLAGSARAAEQDWFLRFEPIFLEAHGHDPHVLNVHEIDLGPPRVDDTTAVSLDTDSRIAYRVGLERGGEEWAWGVDLFGFFTSQAAPRRTAAAGTGAVDEIVFEVADQQFTSTGSSEVLFYETLEDSDLELWTLDLYGTKTLARKSESGSSIRLQFGLRFADFDNDHFQVVGIEDVSGSFLGSSANYDRMMGPLIGLVGDLRSGKNGIRGYFGQSVTLGSAVLTSSSQQFTGSVSASTFVADDTFREQQDVAIPITELRLEWTYQLSGRVACGVGVNTATWHDVPVPPGHVPIEGGDEVFEESTIVLFGVLAKLELRF